MNTTATRKESRSEAYANERMLERATSTPTQVHIKRNYSHTRGGSKLLAGINELLAAATIAALFFGPLFYYYLF